MAAGQKTTRETLGGDVVQKIQGKRAALQAQLALLDHEEKAAIDALAKAGTDRLIAAMAKERFGSVSKGDATKFAKLLSKVGVSRAMEILSKSDG